MERGRGREGYAFWDLLIEIFCSSGVAGRPFTVIVVPGPEDIGGALVEEKPWLALLNCGRKTVNKRIKKMMPPITALAIWKLT